MKNWLFFFFDDVYMYTSELRAVVVWEDIVIQRDHNNNTRRRLCLSQFMATSFSPTTPVRSIFQPHPNPPKTLLSLPAHGASSLLYSLHTFIPILSPHTLNKEEEKILTSFYSLFLQNPLTVSNAHGPLLQAMPL